MSKRKQLHQLQSSWKEIQERYNPGFTYICHSSTLFKSFWRNSKIRTQLYEAALLCISIYAPELITCINTADTDFKDSPLFDTTAINDINIDVNIRKAFLAWMVKVGYKTLTKI